MRLCLLTQLCCLLIVSFGAAAPACAVSLEAVSLRGGGSYSAFEGSFGDAVGKHLTGLTAAGGLGLKLGPVPLQAELWVVAKGGKTSPLSFADYTFPAERWIVQYVEMPLLARFEVGGGEMLRPYVVLGPGVAYRYGGWIDEEGDAYYTSPSATRRLQRARIFEELGSYNPISHFRKVDVDAIAGAGLTLGRGRTRVLFEARWMEGLLNILPEDSFLTGRNRAIVVTLGLERH